MCEDALEVKSVLFSDTETSEDDILTGGRHVFPKVETPGPSTDLLVFLEGDVTTDHVV